MESGIPNIEALKFAADVGKGVLNSFFRLIKRFDIMRKPEYYESFYYGVKPYFEKKLGKETEKFFAAENEFYYQYQKKKRNLSLDELNEIVKTVLRK